MRCTRFLSFLAVAVSVLGVGTVQAQRPKVAITDAKIGLPAGAFSGERTDAQQAAPVFKNQSWAPIYLSLELLDKVPGSAFLKVDTTDDDDLRTTLTIPLGNLSDRNPGEVIRPDELPFIPYVRPGEAAGGSVTLTLYNAEGDRLSEPSSQRYLRGRSKSSYIVVGLGSNLPGFDLPDPNRSANEAPVGARGPLRGGRVETSTISNVRLMPDRWIGYESADLVVLTTGSATNEFLAELFGSPAAEPRRAALLEWVRRGGKLLITVGGNAQLLSQYPVFTELLPVPLLADEPSRAVADLTMNWRAPGGLQKTTTLRSKPGSPFPIARLDEDSDRSGRVLLRSNPFVNAPDQTEYPLVVQSAFGLGKITVVSLDLDRSPVIDVPTDLKASFWDWLVREAGSDRASVGSGVNENVSYGYGYNTEDGFSSALKDRVDDFQEVPVISFGWVALFIALYTLLIGPVEYLFLKKVVGRLELTWVTFPLIVLSVSAAAYFTAYAIKGNDLRINKIDLVDVDPASGRVYGRTWFSIFSPRIDSYNIGVEPRPEWVGTRPNLPTPPTLVGWMAGGRSGGGNIVSRGYAYHTDVADREYADGLLGVPIQVWSTKAFQANWSTWLSTNEPLIESRLYHPPGDPTALSGRIINRLPIGAIQNAKLLYAGSVYDLGSLGSGVPVTPVLDSTTIDADWMKTEASVDNIGSQNQYDYQYGEANIGSSLRNRSLWGLFFYEKALSAGRTDLENAAFRDLDQSWRINDGYRAQAILLARIGPISGPAEDLLTAADGPSPTTLWLRNLPNEGQPRQPVPGTLHQETYIRIFLPVAASPAGRRDPE